MKLQANFPSESRFQAKFGERDSNLAVIFGEAVMVVPVEKIQAAIGNVIADEYIDKIAEKVAERLKGSSTPVISATRPDTAEIGDFWFDTSTGILKICTSLTLPGMAGYPPIPNYTNASGVTVSDKAPSTANKGDLWFCTVDKILYVCTGRDVTVMPPNGVPVWEPAFGAKLANICGEITVGG